jgi:hypothetical protein
MNTKYYVLAEFVNLIGIFERKTAVKKTIIDGTDTPRTTELPLGYWQKGDKIEIDLSTLTEYQLLHLCSQEKNLSIIRCDTDYNQQLEKLGVEIDLYKIDINNKMSPTNENYQNIEMDKFCKNWKGEKALILNTCYMKYYDSMIDSFYLSFIHKKQTK